MKVLQINTEKTWRGGERQTLYTLQGLKDAGIQVELLCLDGYPLFQKAQRVDIPIHGVRGQQEALFFLAQFGRTYDILHAQTAKGQSLAVLAKVFHRRPVVYTRRVDFVPKGNLTRLKYRWTDRVIAISGSIQRILEDFGVANVEMIPAVVVKRELDKTRGERLKDQLGIRNKRVIGTIAALVPHKDPWTMVETVRQLSAVRDDFVFLHFGEGELRTEVEQKIKTYALEGVYKLLGFHEDVEDFFGILDVFVMSSSEEGLGSTVLDAFLYHVPVVSTEAGGLKETVTGRGLLCPVGDDRCLARSIQHLLESGDVRRALTEKAGSDAERLYTLEANMDQYLRVFDRLLQPSAGAGHS